MLYFLYCYYNKHVYSILDTTKDVGHFCQLLVYLFTCTYLFISSHETYNCDSTCVNQFCLFMSQSHIKWGHAYIIRWRIHYHLVLHKMLCFVVQMVLKILSSFYTFICFSVIPINQTS